MSTYALIKDCENDFGCISVVGQLDVGSARELEKTMEALNDEEPAAVLDLTACSSIDASIVAVLLRANRHFRKKWTLVVPEESPLRKIFPLNVDGVLPIESSIEAARLYVSPQSV